jgi:hypothetical protein
LSEDLEEAQESGGFSLINSRMQLVGLLSTACGEGSIFFPLTIAQEIDLPVLRNHAINGNLRSARVVVKLERLCRILYFFLKECANMF